MAKRSRQIKRSKVHRSLVHHSHSWRLVHHKHTHYPALAFLMLLTGVLLVAMTAVTRAADIQVTATVLGEPPPYAAVITKPKNGDRFSKIPIDVKGTCPPNSIVRIYRNNVFSGSVLCSASNTFALKSDLFLGKNTLIARVFNYAEVEGPVSQPVVVYYEKPSGKPPKVVTNQLFLDSDTIFRGYFINQKIDWPVEIGGGVPPYAVSIDWGDGDNDVISLKKAGRFNITHSYSEPGGYKGSYQLIIKASDGEGAKAYLELVVIVNDIKNTVTATTIGPDDSELLSFWKNLYRQILLMWPFYLLALLLLFSFWLGERREYNLLRSKGRLKKAH